MCVYVVSVYCLLGLFVIFVCCANRHPHKNKKTKKARWRWIRNLGGCWAKASLDVVFSILVDALLGCTSGGCGLYRRSTGDDISKISVAPALILPEPMVQTHPS